MIENQGGEAAPVEDTTTGAEPVVSSQDQGGSAPAERDFEAEARDMGWVPETEWKGDKKPLKFLSAEDFVERGETMIPILNKRLKEKDEDFAKRLERMEKMGAKALENERKQHKKEMDELRAERRAAVEAGDTAEFDRIDKALDTLAKAEPTADDDAQPEDNATVQENWVKANAWFNTDEEMAALATGYSQNLLAKHPNLSLSENLKKVDEYMRQKYPLKFGTKGANGHAPVDGGGSNPNPPRNRGKTASDLPPEAKAAGARYVAQKLFPDLNAYAKEYFANE